MSKAHLHRVVQDKRTGRLLTGASVSLCAPGSKTPIDDPIYADANLTQQLPNPFVCLTGVIDIYLADAATVQLVVQYGDAIDTIDYLSIYPMTDRLIDVPAPLAITNSPGTNDVLVGDDANTAHWESLADIYALKTGAVLGWFLSDAYQLNDIVRDTNGALVTATVIWPDDVTGDYVTDTVSDNFPGKIDAWHVTRDGVPELTYTQPELTRDDDGNVIIQPQVVITTGS